ncbi:MAG: nucleotide exchange factor GrpE [Brevinematia bacterium]
MEGMEKEVRDETGYIYSEKEVGKGNMEGSSEVVDSVNVEVGKDGERFGGGEGGENSMDKNVSDKVKQIKEFILSLKQQIEERDRRIKEYEELVRRIAADFDNYKKKVSKEKVEYIRFANKDLVLDLLPIIDNFDRAISAIENSNLDNSAKDLFVGIKLIRKELMNVLLKYGVVSVDVEGKIFDPNISEVIEVEEVESNEGEDKDVVVKEYLKAYKMYDQVIRHAKVKVQKRRRKTEKQSDISFQENKQEDKFEDVGGGGDENVSPSS